MEEFFKIIQDKYANDITSKFPLYRIIIIFIYFLAIYSYTNKDSSMRLMEEISKISITSIFDINSAVYSHLSVLDFAKSIIFTALSSFFYLKFKNTFFALLSKGKDFKAYVGNIRKKIVELKSNDNTLNFFISKDISVELKGHREKLKSLHAYGEVIISFFFCLVYSVDNFNIFDWLITLSLVLSIIYINFFSFKYYISKFIPYYVTERALLGADANFGEE